MSLEYYLTKYFYLVETQISTYTDVKNFGYKILETETDDLDIIEADFKRILKSFKKPITNDWTIEDISRKRIPYGWEALFEEAYEELVYISNNLEERNKTYGHFVPDKVNLFKAFELTPLHKIKVVILGQDPYHTILQDGTPVAQGLAFSIKKSGSMQPSLQNIFKEIKRTHQDFEIPNHGDLTFWAKQGVFLLNSALTTDRGVAGAHSKFMVWNSFIIKVFEHIKRVNPTCIFLLWGKDAQKFKKYIGNKSIILETSHPSPFSVNRGFNGCGHFLTVNQHLEAEDQINWNLPP